VALVNNQKEAEKVVARVDSPWRELVHQIDNAGTTISRHVWIGSPNDLGSRVGTGNHLGRDRDDSTPPMATICCPAMMYWDHHDVTSTLKHSNPFGLLTCFALDHISSPSIAEQMHPPLMKISGCDESSCVAGFLLLPSMMVIDAMVLPLALFSCFGCGHHQCVPCSRHEVNREFVERFPGNVESMWAIEHPDQGGWHRWPQMPLRRTAPSFHGTDDIVVVQPAPARLWPR
jgi:hypothetical protein